jgi:hypothetical protein
MFSSEAIQAIESLVSEAFAAARGNVVTCDANEKSVRLTVHSINGTTVASFFAGQGWPLFFRASDGVRHDPSWPTIQRIVDLVAALHAGKKQEGVS